MLSVKPTISLPNYLKQTCCHSQNIPTAAGKASRRTISHGNILHWHHRVPISPQFMKQQ